MRCPLSERAQLRVRRPRAAQRGGGLSRRALELARACDDLAAVSGERIVDQVLGAGLVRVQDLRQRLLRDAGRRSRHRRTGAHRNEQRERSRRE
jgi:hypothetical protein